MGVVVFVTVDVLVAVSVRVGVSVRVSVGVLVEVGAGGVFVALGGGVSEGVFVGVSVGVTVGVEVVGAGVGVGVTRGMRNATPPCPGPPNRVRPYSLPSVAWIRPATGLDPSLSAKSWSIATLPAASIRNRVPTSFAPP